MCFKQANVKYYVDIHTKHARILIFSETLVILPLQNNYYSPIGRQFLPDYFNKLTPGSILKGQATHLTSKGKLYATVNNRHFAEF